MIPDWLLQLPMNIIKTKACDHGLDPLLVASICWQESKGFVYAVRYEPNYRWVFKQDKFAKMNKITEQTENNLQMQSYGLMQIMGGTVRWLGFTGALPALFKAENNLYWSCKYIKYLKNKYKNQNDVISSYNAGNPAKNSLGRYKNQDYVDGVLGFYNQLKHKK